MLAFCCIFIIASCQTFTANILNIHEILDNVDAVARLMIDLSPDDENAAYYQGLLVLRRVEALRKTLEQRKRQDSNIITGEGALRDVNTVQVGLSTPNSSSNTFSSETNPLGMEIEEIYPVDGFWDFSMFLPMASWQ